MYLYSGFTKRLRKKSSFPNRLKEKTDYPMPSVAFYHHGYINTDFCVENLKIRGGLEIFARHNPQVVGFFTPGGWEFPTSW